MTEFLEVIRSEHKLESEERPDKHRNNKSKKLNWISIIAPVTVVTISLEEENCCQHCRNNDAPGWVIHNLYNKRCEDKMAKVQNLIDMEKHHFQKHTKCMVKTV